MRFVAVGSGSRGNATLVETGDTRLLVDCGFSLRETECRLALLGVEPDSLAGIVVTHEHGDHVAGVARLARRYRLPVWATPGTWRAAGCPSDVDVRLFVGHGRGFRIGDIGLKPFPVPHDAREPCQFVIEGGGRRLGMLTDAGSVSTRARESLRGCDGLILETNHDKAMLRSGPYPPALRARVGGAFGHLSNDQAAALLDELDHQHIKHLMLAHISAHNNRPELARAAVCGVSEDLGPRLCIAPQASSGSWLQL
jgi:phosphoribosyl 1,2-cyclic phosphodiesterase